jgi:DNA-binding transcriptional MocR family regulator
MTITIPRTPTPRDLLARRRFQVPIVEDDAYGFIPTHGPPPLAAIAPDICWHIAGLAKRIALACVWLTSSRQTFQPRGRSTAQCARSA